MTLNPYATIIAHIDDLAICEDGFGDLLYAEIPESCAELGTAIETEILHAITDVCETADTLYVFEAPIDLMSYISLHRHQPWHKSSYLSLGGLADDALRRFLSEYPDIRKIVFCLDNDTDKPENWGQAAAQKYSRNYGKKRLTRIDIPCLKDWNAVLCSAHEERL